MNAQLIPAEVFESLRTLDEQVRDDARRIHAEHIRGQGEWRPNYIKATLSGGYDDDEQLVALRAAIRRGIEIGRAA